MLLKLMVMLLAAGAGIASAVVVASPFLWLLNQAASDGPTFPPPLVAAGFFALPHAALLFLLQLGVSLYEIIRRKNLGAGLWLIGLIGGVAVGWLWHFGLLANRLEFSTALLALSVSAIQGLVVFACHWFSQRWLKPFS